MLETVDDVVSAAFLQTYSISMFSTSFMLVGTTVIALAGGVFVLVRDLIRKKTLPVAVVAGVQVQLPILTAGQKWHVFLSYTWRSGQDQVRSIKQLLKEVLPGIRVFLDVDVTLTGP